MKLINKPGEQLVKQDEVELRKYVPLIQVRQILVAPLQVLQLSVQASHILFTPV